MTSPRPTPATTLDYVALVRAHHRNDGTIDLGALALHGIAPLPGGRNNTLYRCLTDDGPCCIKVYRTDSRRRDEREWHTLTFLATHLPGIAPRPLHHAPNDRLPMVAMEYLPGKPLHTLPLTDQHLAALATQYRQLAAITPATAPFPYHAHGTVPAILTRVEHWAATAPTDLRPLVARWLAGTDPATLRRETPPCFGHSDPNLANWLWDDHSATFRRVDLEYAGWSDLTGELADLIEGPWARLLPDPTWLTFAAQFPNLDQTRFAAARRLFALFWVTIFATHSDSRLPAQLTRAATLLETATSTPTTS